MSAFVFADAKTKDPQAMATVFYELSSTTFYGLKCVLMKWGHCKEGYQAFISTVDAIVMGCHSFEKVVTFDP